MTKHTQTQFGFDREGNLVTGDYTGKFIKQQPKITGIKSFGKNPVVFKELTDKEFLALGASEDDKRPVLKVVHKNWAADGFRLHLLTNVKDECKCRSCKKRLSPDYKCIIPREFKGECEMSRDEILSALNSMNIFSREGSGVCILNFCNGELSIHATSEETGKSDSVIQSAKIKDGSINLRIGFNTEFLIDAVKSLEEKLTFKYSGLGRPAMIISGHRSIVIMPMHLG